MAIFKFQPSPFCVLDEVDAPLDEANIIRLTKLVKEMSGNTQFIFITHAKRTMEASQSMYGVTMQEPGVSKLVSVKFHGGEEPTTPATLATPAAISAPAVTSTPTAPNMPTPAQALPPGAPAVPTPAK